MWMDDPDGIGIVLVEVPADYPLRRDPRPASAPRWRQEESRKGNTLHRLSPTPGTGDFLPRFLPKEVASGVEMPSLLVTAAKMGGRGHVLPAFQAGDPMSATMPYLWTGWRSDGVRHSQESCPAAGAE
jgi:hypothetical protein